MLYYNYKIYSSEENLFSGILRAENEDEARTFLKEVYSNYKELMIEVHNIKGRDTELFLKFQSSLVYIEDKQIKLFEYRVFSKDHLIKDGLIIAVSAKDVVRQLEYILPDDQFELYINEIK